MKCDIFLMILNSKKHEGQIPKMELALLFQISLHLYTSFCSTRPERAEAPSPGHRPGYNGNPQGALKGQQLLAQGTPWV